MSPAPARPAKGGLATGAAAAAQRLDLWLWCARITKTRADAAHLAANGGLRLDGRVVDKAHARVRPGDVLTFARHGQIRVLRIAGLAARRGPPAQARGLYEELAAEPLPPALSD